MSWWTFIPAPDNICRALTKFRQDILANEFNISKHANDRMVQRGISLDEVIECVKEGQMGSNRKVQDLISGCFWYKGLVVLVGAEYGNYYARPHIITVFNDGEQYTPYIEDLVIREEPKPANPVLPTTTPAVVPSLDALSDDELERILMERKAKRAEQEKAQRDEKLRQLDLAIARHEEKLKETQAALDALRKQRLELVPFREVKSTAEVDYTRFAEAMKDPVYKVSGYINVKATAEQYGLVYSDLMKYIQQFHPNLQMRKGR